MKRRNKEEQDSARSVSRDAGTVSKTTQIAEEGQEMVEVGAVYKEKDGKQEVTPFFVDRATARVRFSPVGPRSGREDDMRTSDFLNRFEKADKSALAEATPEESQEAAQKRLTSDKEA